MCVFVRVSLKGVYKWRRRWSYQGLSVLVRAEQLPLACGDVGWSPWQPWLRRGGLALLAEVCRQRWWHDGLHVFEVECIIQVSVKKRQAVTPIKDVKQNLKKHFYLFIFFNFKVPWWLSSQQLRLWVTSSFKFGSPENSSRHFLHNVFENIWDMRVKEVKVFMPHHAQVF